MIGVAPSDFCRKAAREACPDTCDSLPIKELPFCSCWRIWYPGLVMLLVCITGTPRLQQPPMQVRTARLHIPDVQVNEADEGASKWLDATFNCDEAGSFIAEVPLAYLGDVHDMSCSGTFWSTLKALSFVLLPQHCSLNGISFCYPGSGPCGR